MASRPCPECGSTAVRWRVKDHGGNGASFFGTLLRGIRAGNNLTHPDNWNLNPLRYFDPTPTSSEQAIVESITEPFELAPGERVLSWRCAACGRSGEIVERRRKS